MVYLRSVLRWVHDLLQSSLIFGLGLPHLFCAFGGLFADGVYEADLHVQGDSVLLKGKQVLQQVDWCFGGVDHLSP